MHCYLSRCVGAAILAVAASSSLADTAPLKTETSDVATLGANVPHRFLTVGYGDSAIIYDGDTGQIEGQVATAHGSNVAWSPDASHIYVAETMWTHLNRGTKLSLLDVYDTKTLTLQKEIELPGRALVGMKIKTLDINASGKRAYVFDLRPASSVMWVNLETQKMGATLETPGCALVFAWGEDGVSSLCGDGTLASITFPKEGKPTITHSAPFFDAEHDPIFDNAIVDHATDTAQFLSYTGLIYTVKLGAQPQIGKPWSINESAGFKKAGTGVTELAWRPSGHQPFAWHKDSDRIFVLMHPGSYWSHVAAPTEIWVLNVKTHALLARYPLKDKLANSVESIAVTQKDKPQLIIMTEHSGHVLWNADTGEELRKIEFGQGGAAVVPGL